MLLNAGKFITAFLALGASVFPAQAAPTAIGFRSAHNPREISYGHVYARSKRPASSSPGGTPPPSKVPQPNTPTNPSKPLSKAPSKPGSAASDAAAEHKQIDKGPYSYKKTKVGTEQIYEFWGTDKSAAGLLGQYGIGAEKDMITVYQAWNDKDSRPTGRMAFSDMLMWSWKTEGRAPEGLSKVRFHNVVNEDVEDVLKKVEKDKQVQFPVELKASDTGYKGDLFKNLGSVETKNTLMGNSLTGSLQKILKSPEMKPKKITTIYVFKQGSSFMMDITLGA